jgi:hypothetical protein
MGRRTERDGLLGTENTSSHFATTGKDVLAQLILVETK